MAYQSITSSADSDSSGKLAAMRMPDVHGKKFLDLGCNEGFFCGAALAGGAVKAVGVDTGQAFIEGARNHFPGGEFHVIGWDDFLSASEETFDVILFASAIHYSQDQLKSLELALANLTADGTLILECGIGPANDADGIYVKQVRYDGIERLYFTLDSLRRVLEDRGYYIFQELQSVAQGGDAFPRSVFHIRKTQAVIFYNFDSPNSGKTFITNFFRPGIAYKSLDKLAHQMMDEIDFAPLDVGEANVDFFWETIERLSMRHLAVSRICDYILESTAEATYVEGWLPPSLKLGVLAWLNGSERPAFGISLTHGKLVPKTVTPVRTFFRSTGVWFRNELEKSHIDQVTAFTFTSGDYVEFAVTGWYDAIVGPPKNFLMFHNGFEIYGRLLFEPPRADIAEFGNSFVATFIAPADSIDRIGLRDFPHFALEGDSRALHFLKCPAFEDRFVRVEVAAAETSADHGNWQHVPKLFPQ